MELDEQDILDTAINDGARNEKITIARGMKAEGLDIDLIIKLTGLTKEEVEKL